MSKICHYLLGFDLPFKVGNIRDTHGDPAIPKMDSKADVERKKHNQLCQIFDLHDSKGEANKWTTGRHTQRIIWPNTSKTL